MKNKQEVLLENVTLKKDLSAYKTASIKSATLVGVLEFIPGKERGKFMDELYRVMADAGTVAVTVPYWASFQAVQDYMYEWPPMQEVSFMYFNKGWRKANGLESRGLVCDFDFTYGYAVAPDVAQRSDETRSFAIRNYLNSVQNHQQVLTKRPAETK